MDLASDPGWAQRSPKLVALREQDPWEGENEFTTKDGGSEMPGEEVGESGTENRLKAVGGIKRIASVKNGEPDQLYRTSLTKKK